MENRYKAWIYLLLAMSFWGMSFIWTKQLLVFISPITIIFIRLVLSTLFLIILSLILGKLQKVDKSTLKWIALLSFFEPFLYFLLEGYGIQKTTASFASIMIATIPLFTPIGARLFLKEKLTKMNLLGLIISFSGVAIIVMNKNIGENISTIGVLLLLGAVISTIGYFVLLKKVADEVNAFSIATYQNVFGIIYFAPIFFFTNGVQELNNMPFTTELLYPILALAVLASSLAFVFNTIGVRLIGASKAAAFTNSIPIFTVIFAYFLLDESVGFTRLTGMSVVILGLVLAQKKPWKRPTIWPRN